MDGSSQAVRTPAKRRLGDLGVRAVSGLALIAVSLLTAEVGGHLFMLMWALAGAAVLREWQRIVGGAAIGARVLVGVAAIVAAALLVRASPPAAMLVLLAAAGVMAILAGPGARAWAAGGVIYAGMLVVAVIALRLSVFFGSRAIIWLFAVVWSSDVFAYFGGRLIGGRKLWPRISPSKTWAGTLCGLAAGALIGTFAAVRDLGEPTAIIPVLALSLTAGILSQAGDAFESAIKRHFGVKDSGHLIPGHGGVMDRLDGFIAAAVFAFLVGLVRGLPSVAGGLFYWA